MKQQTVIGVDLGGTKVKAARINGQEVEKTDQRMVSATAGRQQVLAEVAETIGSVCDPSVVAIGIGVPGIVDVERGIVYDVINIPSWKEVPLRDWLAARFGLPVFVNNDANCFALGEKHFGKGRGHDHLLGLIVGTGMAAGLILHGKLYNGHNCAAGEFGMIPYLDHYLEYYCAGQFFSNVHGTTGEVLSRQAKNGDEAALAVFREFGFHLGNALQAILYALDPPLIIMGGSVSKDYAFFQEALWQRLREAFVFQRVVARLTIEVSEDPHMPVLGAAALYYNAQR